MCRPQTPPATTVVLPCGVKGKETAGLSLCSFLVIMAWAMAQLVEDLACMEPQVLIPAPYNPAMVKWREEAQKFKAVFSYCLWE